MKRLAAVAMVSLLGACGEPLPEGDVYGKQYKPAYDSTWMQPITQQMCTGGKATTCTTITTGYIPVTTHHAECYEIRYRAADKTSKVCVSEHEYENLEIGSHYVRSAS